MDKIVSKKLVSFRDIIALAIPSKYKNKIIIVGITGVLMSN